MYYSTPGRSVMTCSIALQKALISMPTPCDGFFKVSTYVSTHVALMLR